MERIKFESGVKRVCVFACWWLLSVCVCVPSGRFPYLRRSVSSLLYFSILQHSMWLNNVNINEEESHLNTKPYKLCLTYPKTFVVDLLPVYIPMNLGDWKTIKNRLVCHTIFVRCSRQVLIIKWILTEKVLHLCLDRSGQKWGGSVKSSLLWQSLLKIQRFQPRFSLFEGVGIHIVYAELKTGAWGRMAVRD